MNELVSDLSPILPSEGRLVDLQGGLKIVVADDSAEFREATCDLLQAFFDVDVVGAGKDGLEALQLSIAFEPDLLIMNTNMPGLDGVRAAELISRYCPTTTILMMSGDDSPQLRERCRSAGAHGFTSKQDLTGQFTQLCCQTS